MAGRAVYDNKNETGVNMGKSLADYAAENPNPDQMPIKESESVAETAALYSLRETKRNRVEELKDCIAQEIQQGIEPELILFPAIQAIGTMTDDPAWTEAQLNILDGLYRDYRQQSLFVSDEVVKARRLETMQQEYSGKLRRQLQRQLTGYRRIEKALTEALQAVNEVNPAEAPEE